MCHDITPSVFAQPMHASCPWWCCSSRFLGFFAFRGGPYMFRAKTYFRLNEAPLPSWHQMRCTLACGWPSALIICA